MSFCDLLAHFFLSLNNIPLYKCSTVSVAPNACPVYYLQELTPQVVLVVRNSSAKAGDERDAGSVPGPGRSPGGGHGNPLQYSCLENPMDRGAWWATIHGVAKSWT